MSVVEKHQSGKHDQSTHGAWAKGGAMRAGWSQRSNDEILAEFQARFRSMYPNDQEHADNMAEEFASWTAKYDGPNNTSITVELHRLGEQPDPETMDTVMWTVDRLQKQNPVQDLEVMFSFRPFRDEAQFVPAEAEGFVIRGEKKINLQPDLARDIGMSAVRDDGHFMPAAANVSKVEYYLTHEYGHVRDTRNRGQVNDDRYRLADLETSGYGATNEYEKYAEAYTEWSLTNGETTNITAQTYADKYFWAENLEKAMDDDDEMERIIIVDTFDAANPPSARPYPKTPEAATIKVAPGLKPILKHQRGKHDQKSHGRRGSSERSPFYDELEEEQREALEYLMGDRPFPPGYSPEGVPPPTITISESLGNKIRSARKKIREWRADRERRALARMTPDELSALGAANRAREALRQGFTPAMAKSVDPALRVLYRVFSDVVEPEVWFALVQHQSPLEEIDGPLGRLLDDMLGAVLPGPVMIKLAPGLRPVLKHQSGKHDQKSHGTWARGRAGEFSEWGDRAARIRAARDVGPDLSRVARVFQRSKDFELDEVIEETILDNYGEVISEVVEERKEQIRSMSQEEIMSAYGSPVENFVSASVANGKSRSEAIEKFREMQIADVRRQVEEQWVIDYDLETRYSIERDLVERITPGLEEMMNIRHPVTINGMPDEIVTEVTNVEVHGLGGPDPKILIAGSIRNSQGEWIGEMFEREIQLSETSPSGKPQLEAENKLLRINDERYQRQGFATAFNERTYDMYIANDIDTVFVYTAWEGGAVWAKRGFDWNPNRGADNINVAADALNYVADSPDASSKTRARAQQMLDDMSVSSGVDDVDFPTPMEVVMLGYTPNASTWVGQEAMMGQNWYGKKFLTPDNLSEVKRRKDELKFIAEQDRQAAGQKKLFTFTEQPAARGSVGEPQPLPNMTIEELLEPTFGSVPRVRTPEGAAKYGKPIGAPIRAVEKKMSRWDKLQAQAEFYEKWLEETNRELDDDDPEVERQFYAAAAEAMPWLVD